jgi:thioesterase superfamily protein
MKMASSTDTRNAAVSISELAGCSGLELVERLADGSVLRPSMAEALPFTLLPPEQGKVGLLATPEARFCNLTNTVHGGWTMTMLDTAMSLAAQMTLSAGETCPSHETPPNLSARYRPIPASCTSPARWFRAAGPSSRWRAGSRMPKAGFTLMARRRVWS